MSDPVLEGALADGRREALALMRDTCTVERKSGVPVMDEDTGQDVQAWAEVYGGVCRVKQVAQGAGQQAEFGEHEVTLHRYTVVLPWDTVAEINREDRLTVTVSDDAWLIGRPLEVIDISYAGTATARRLAVEDKAG